MTSPLVQATARQNATNGARPFYQPDTIDQYATRQNRGQRREAMMQEQSRAEQNRRNMQSMQHFVSAQRQQTPDARVVLDGAERMQQVNARSEMYGEECFGGSCFGNGSAYAERPQSCSKPCNGGSKNAGVLRQSHGGFQQGKLPSAARHTSIVQQAIPSSVKRDYNRQQTRAYHDKVAETLRRQHPLANGDVQTPGLTINAVQAEKESYASQHEEGNEEAYAEVKAMQRSWRGYDDTSEKTLQRLKIQNARETARFGGLATCGTF